MAVHNPHTRTHAVFLAALRSAPPPGDDFDRGNHRSRPLEVGLCDDDVTAHDPATSTVHATAAANPRVKVDVPSRATYPSLQARVTRTRTYVY